MTKLTIQHEGKSYGVTDESHFMVLAVVNSLIDKGYLVELQPQEEKTEQSTLSKLRAELEELEKYIKDASYERKTSDTYSMKGYLEGLDDVKNILNELETQPSQPEISNEWAREAGKDFAKKHLSQPQPIEKLPQFTRNIVEEEAMNRHASSIITLAGQVDILIEHISIVTSTLNQVIERINNK